MGLFSKLTEKPWVATSGGVDALPEGGAVAVPAARIGLRLFLAVASVIFMLLIVAYGERMVYEDWRPAPQPKLLWLNTGLLVLASIGLEWARMSARNADIDGIKTGLIAGGVFSFAFLAGQIMAWRQLDALPAFDLTNPSISFFYLITALHGLHLLGGLVAWARTANRVWHGVALSRVRLSVELCTTYWHYLLVVWLILFGLLFSGNENLELLLTICGFR